MTNTVLLCLGSNFPDREQRIASACESLTAHVRILRASQTVISDDITGRGPQYANKLLECSTDLTHDQLRQELKNIEHAQGRTPQSKSTGQIPLDIDIINWNTTPLKPLPIPFPQPSH